VNTFIGKHRHIWPVSWLCEVLDVSRSGFHAWLTRPTSAREIHDAKLFAAIETSFKTSDRTYGARRVWRDVLEEGLACGRHRIERLMRSNALRARPRRRGKPKDDGERSVIADNIPDRAFQADRPNQKWLADFPYIWTAEGWLYVAAVLDLFSRRVVGWSMKADRDASLVMDALMMAVWRRGKADALLHHSDQGSQYTSGQDRAASGRQRDHLLDEPGRQYLGSSHESATAPNDHGEVRDGELLLLAEDRTDRPQDLSHPRQSPCRGLRLHRTLLHPTQAGSETGLPQPHGDRGPRHATLTCWP
jgi:transposase InsO family protein